MSKFMQVLLAVDIEAGTDAAFRSSDLQVLGLTANIFYLLLDDNMCYGCFWILLRNICVALLLLPNTEIIQKYQSKMS